MKKTFDYIRCRDAMRAPNERHPETKRECGSLFEAEGKITAGAGRNEFEYQWELFDDNS